jgi:dTDP-4-dehydrorhamnose reductase
MKVAVVGAEGQLGMDVSMALGEAGLETVALRHADLEIASVDSVLAVLRELRPQAIVNSAAMHHVEACEQDPARAYAVNAVGARNLAIAALDQDIILVHVSTDYVFDGKKQEPYVEADAPLPLNVYGNTKLAGEHFVRATAPRHFVVRSSALYGRFPCRGKGGRNFVELMLKLATERDEVRVVNDEVVSPTWTGELSRQILELLRTDAYGLYHATAEGSCSWYEFAAEILRRTGVHTSLSVADPKEFGAKVPRPKYSVLENKALKEGGLNRFRDWRKGLQDYLTVRA